MRVAPAPSRFRTYGQNLLKGCALLLLGPLSSSAQLTISEFMADNDRTVVDEDGDSSDWIEIFHGGPAAMDVGGHYLTDDPAFLDKWMLPGTWLDPGAYLVVFASGKNRAASGSELHTSFQIERNGEYLALVAPDGLTILSEFLPVEHYEDVAYGVSRSAAVVEEALILPGAACSLSVPGGDIGLGWTEEGFDDLHWRSAATGVGYEVGSGPYPALFGAQGDLEAEMANRRNGVYLRVPFELPAGASVSALTLRMKYDDGFVAYLNGVRVMARNAPAAPAWNSLATAPHRDAHAVVYEDYNLSAHAGLLHPGPNLLAIHGLNDAPDSLDFLLLPELHGTVTTPSSSENIGYFPQPTPGAPNGQAFAGLVDDTEFSIDRGFYPAPFDVVVTCNTPGATIIHTTDGSVPSNTNGIRSSPAGPDAPGSATVRITTTTTLRAIATKPGFVPTNVDTQTYLFLDDVVEQPNDPAGFPATWGEYLIGPRTGLPRPADYGMWPSVVNTHAATIIDDLKSLPTLSVVMDNADLFERANGIYPNSYLERDNRERRASLEWIDPAAQEDFQVDAGIRQFGAAVRVHWWTPKKSFMLRFRREHGGPPKLDFPLFAGNSTDAAVPAVEEFETLALRGGLGDSWLDKTVQSSQYLRDQFARESHLAMGQPSPHGRWVHLYFNGLYWGLYNLLERPDADFAASYSGGRAEDYDAIKHASQGCPTCYAVNEYEVIEGDAVAWRSALNLAAAGLSGSASYDAFRALVNVENLADYILLNHYVGNADWPHKNWYATRRREPGAGFQFHSWDAEYSLARGGPSHLDINIVDRLQPGSHPNTPGFLFGAVRQNAEFRVLFGDRVHKHLFNDGALQADKNIARYQALAALIEGGIRTESARWGDNETASQGNLRFTYEGDWNPQKDVMLGQYFPQRHAIALHQLRSAGLYPNLEAPTFHRHGGIVPAGFNLTMSGPGTVYYTLDGSDPRLPGGAIAPGARIASGVGLTNVQLLPSGAPVKALVPEDDSLGREWTKKDFDDAAWAEGTTGVGFDIPGDFDPLIGLDVEASMHGRKTTVYLRTEFDISDPALLQSLTLKMKYDDGFVAYLNGTKIAGSRDPATPAWNSAATSPTRDVAAVVFQDFDVSAHLATLQAGRNVLAIHGLNNEIGGSDLLMVPEIWGEEVTGGSAVSLNGAVAVKARAQSGNSWSALTQATFHAGSVLANASNLVISKIHYRPSAASGDEIAAGHDRRSDFEFVELMNIGPAPITLAGLRFAGAFSFSFPSEGPSSNLAPGARMLVVNNQAAFEFRNGPQQAGQIAGEFTDGKLSNDGEQILLLDREDAIVLRLTYNDAGAWPDSPDGNGPALVLIAPESAPGLDDPASWRPSVLPGGSPGQDDRLLLADWLRDNDLGDPNDDPDGNGITNLLAFALGADLTPSPNDATPPAPTLESFEVDGRTDFYPVFRYRARIGADEIAFHPEESIDLETWLSDGLVFVSTMDNGDGTMTIAVRSSIPFNGAGRRFFWLRVEN